MIHSFAKGLALPLVVLTAFAVGGCSKNDTAEYSTEKDTTDSATDTEITSRTTTTRVGEAMPAPENQHENATDLGTTQKIRQQVVADDTLSINAKNVKIITANGMVTLRGPVNSLDEKNKIANTARQVAGIGNVNDQLEVNSGAIYDSTTTTTRTVNPNNLPTPNQNETTTPFGQ